MGDHATDGDRTPQSALFQEARERNTRSQQLIEGTIRIIARSRELLSVNTYVAAVKSFLGFAHRVGFTRFNAAPLIKLKKAPRQVAQRIMADLVDARGEPTSYPQTLEAPSELVSNRSRCA